MTYETILYEIYHTVLTITLNRPDRLNAFNAQMRADLIDAFDHADAGLSLSSPAWAADRIKVGALFPLSGGAGKQGQQVTQAIQAMAA